VQFLPARYPPAQALRQPVPSVARLILVGGAPQPSTEPAETLASRFMHRGDKLVPPRGPRGSGPQPPPFPPQEQEPPGRPAPLAAPGPDHGETSHRGLGRLEDRVALVSGGDSGIGRAVALAFAREGANIAISYLDEHDDARETQRLVKETGRRALLLPADVSDDASCAEIVQSAVEELGRLDILVNNAAYQGKTAERFEQIDADRVRQTLLANLASMFFLTRHALAHLRPGGAIINTTSIDAYQPHASILDYAASKGAIVNFTKGLGQELAARGIRVNAVAQVTHFGSNTPLSRPAPPAELALAYVFLACDESRFVTGEVLGVTGGLTFG
jgi:NAD(P)-dependent dehydrogenase (short-subunit alcohol dehydrogenase family)